MVFPQKPRVLQSFLPGVLPGAQTGGVLGRTPDRTPDRTPGRAPCPGRTPRQEIRLGKTIISKNIRFNIFLGIDYL